MWKETEYVVFKIILAKPISEEYFTTTRKKVKQL